MVDWEDSYKRYVTRKYEEIMGEPLPIGNISTCDVNVDLDITLLSIDEMAYMYAFAIMKEDFEQAKILSDEFEKRNSRIEIEVDADEKTAIVNVYLQPNKKIESIDIKMKILSDGMMIDFDEDDNF